MSLEEYAVRKTFEKNIIVMKFLGLQPFESCPGIFNAYAYFILFVFIVPVPVLELWGIYVSEPSQWYRLLQNSYVAAEIAGQIIKVLPFKRYPGLSKRRIFDVWNKDNVNSYTELDKRFIDRSIMEYNIIFWGFALSCLIGFIFFVSVQIFSSREELPYFLVFPFDVLSDVRIYTAASVYLHITVVVLAFTNTILDTLLAGVLLQSATHLRILKNRIQNMDDYVKENINKIILEIDHKEREALCNKLIHEKILKCIQLHATMTLYAKDLEKVFSTQVFAQFFIQVMILTSLILELGIEEVMSSEFFLNVYVFITFISEILLFCYYGNMLHFESITFPDAIFMGSWYNYDKKSKKLLLILMKISNRPIKLTAGKILDLSLETFTLILKRSYSLLALLKNYG